MNPANVLVLLGQSSKPGAPLNLFSSLRGNPNIISYDFSIADIERDNPY
jgi:hypothetical protein